MGTSFLRRFVDRQPVDAELRHRFGYVNDYSQQVSI
jgi:hypothetical protein